MLIYWLLPMLCAALGIPLCFAAKVNIRAGEGDFISAVSSGAEEVRKLRLVYMPRRSAVILCILFGILFTVMSSVRLSVGHDYNLYANWVYNLNFQSVDEVGHTHQENGLMLPLKVLSVATAEFYPAFTVISLLIYPPLMVFTAKYSDCAWISILSFLFIGAFFNSMCFMRQFIAAVICAYALVYCVRKRFLRYAVIVLLAVTFHRSALIMLPVYFIFRIKWNRYTLIGASVLTAAAFVMLRPMVNFTVKYFYQNYDPEYSAELNGGLDPFLAIVFTVIFIGAFLLRKHMSGSDNENDMLISCAFFTAFFEIMGVKSGLASRFSLLFIIPVCILLLPKIYSALSAVIADRIASASSAAGISACIICTAGASVYGVLLLINYNGVVPYTTLWQGYL